jgi:hypothetical protein
MAKRGAHAPPFLLAAPEGFKSFEDAYGAQNLVDSEDWLMGTDGAGVRIVTGAPEIKGVMGALKELNKRGVVFSIGHRRDLSLFNVSSSRKLQLHLVLRALTSLPQRYCKGRASLRISSTPCLSCIIGIRLSSDYSVPHRIYPPPPWPTHSQLP